jgi:hypothetical protein
MSKIQISTRKIADRQRKRTRRRRRKQQLQQRKKHSDNENRPRELSRAVILPTFGHLVLASGLVHLATSHLLKRVNVFTQTERRPIIYPHVSDRIRTVRLPYHRALTVSYPRPRNLPSCDLSGSYFVVNTAKLQESTVSLTECKKNVPKTVTSRNTRIFIR